MFDIYDIMAFAVFAVLLAVGVILIVVLGSLPGWVARKRGHPQVAAVNVASWIGLATLGLLWPFALIWAFLNPRPGPESTKEVASRSTFLTVSYVAFVAVLFKFKVVKPRPLPIVLVMVAGVLLIGGVFVVWMQCAPLSGRVVTTQYVVQLVPYVKGQVKKVAAQPNQPIKKGDLLLEIDPEPYQYTVDQLAGTRSIRRQNNVKAAGASDGGRQSEDVAKAAATINQAQAALDQARAAVARPKAAVDKAKASDDLAKTEEQIMAGFAEDGRGGDQCSQSGPGPAKSAGRGRRL